VLWRSQRLRHDIMIAAAFGGDPQLFWTNVRGLSEGGRYHLGPMQDPLDT